MENYMAKALKNADVAAKDVRDAKMTFPAGTRVDVHSDDYNGSGTVVGYSKNMIGLQLVEVQTDLHASQPMSFYTRTHRSQVKGTQQWHTDLTSATVSSFDCAIFTSKSFEETILGGLPMTSAYKFTLTATAGYGRASHRQTLRQSRAGNSCGRGAILAPDGQT